MYVEIIYLDYKEVNAMFLDDEQWAWSSGHVRRLRLYYDTIPRTEMRILINDFTLDHWTIKLVFNIPVHLVSLLNKGIIISIVLDNKYIFYF